MLKKLSSIKMSKAIGFRSISMEGVLHNYEKLHDSVRSGTGFGIIYKGIYNNIGRVNQINQ